MDKNVHLYRSPYPAVQLPNVPYHKFLLDRMAQHDQAKPALVDSVTGRALTYGALRSGIEAFGAWLLRRGFGKGQTLALISYNLPEYAIVFHVRPSNISPIINGRILYNRNTAINNFLYNRN
jgi:non-ribosomal peptide synthetase component E (peptide arylation enzyme)